jgi:hypothetical protein
LRAKRAAIGKTRKAIFLGANDIINYKYTKGVWWVCGIRWILVESCIVFCGAQTLECLITFEYDEGNTAIFVGVGHRCGAHRGGVGFTVEVLD